MYSKRAAPYVNAPSPPLSFIYTFPSHLPCSCFESGARAEKNHWPLLVSVHTLLSHLPCCCVCDLFLLLHLPCSFVESGARAEDPSLFPFTPFPSHLPCSSFVESGARAEEGHRPLLVSIHTFPSHLPCSCFEPSRRSTLSAPSFHSHPSFTPPVLFC